MESFNPRTYIRYDIYKLRVRRFIFRFQSTYLYKVRLFLYSISSILSRFNPRTYIRYDDDLFPEFGIISGFNPRTYIRYDLKRDITADGLLVSIHVPI